MLHQRFAIFNASTADATDLVKLPLWVNAVWARTTEDTTDPVTTGGVPPKGNERKACPPPFHPDTAVVVARKRQTSPPPRGTIPDRGTANNKLCVWVWDKALSSDSRTPQLPPGIEGERAGRVQASAVASLSWGGSFHIDVQAKDDDDAVSIIIYSPHDMNEYFTNLMLLLIRRRMTIVSCHRHRQRHTTLRSTSLITKSGAQRK